ncbi:MAG: CDP-alcohol phosphatidyltransferase family protein [Ardenticatenales bacterium]
MIVDPTTPDPDRRPLGARHWRLSYALAEWLVRRGVSANTVSLAGMVAGVAAGLCLWRTAHADATVQRLYWLAAAALIGLRGSANMLDGMVAVGSDKASPIGALYNDVPDRVSDVATLIGLGGAAGGDVVLGLVAALMAVLTAYVRAIGRASGGPSAWDGPMAKTHRMALVVAVALCMAVAPAAAHPLGAAYGWPAIALLVIALGCAVTIARRLRRIARAMAAGGGDVGAA